MCAHLFLAEKSPIDLNSYQSNHKCHIKSENHRRLRAIEDEKKCDIYR